MEITASRVLIIADSTARKVLNEVLFGPFPDLGKSIASPSESGSSKKALDGEIQRRNQTIDNAVRVGFENNSFKVYRQNLEL